MRIIFKKNVEEKWQCAILGGFIGHLSWTRQRFLIANFAPSLHLILLFIPIVFCFSHNYHPLLTLFICFHHFHYYIIDNYHNHIYNPLSLSIFGAEDIINTLTLSPSLPILPITSSQDQNQIKYM